MGLADAEAAVEVEPGAGGRRLAAEQAAPATARILAILWANSSAVRTAVAWLGSFGSGM